MINRKSLLIFMFMLFVSGCATVGTPVLNEAENVNSKRFLSIIHDMNVSSPDTISSSFTADGITVDKKFRVDGTVDFDKKGYYRVKVIDYVFKSPVMEAYRELDRLYFYYPADGKLLVDDVNRIDLARYTGFKTDYRLLYTLLTGGIPLLDNFTVYKCLRDENNTGYNLIIENGEYFENIFFRDDVPEKILFIHKLSRDKSEIYLKSIAKEGKSIFFKSYKIVVPELSTNINIIYSRPRLNKALIVDRLKQDKLPKQTEIVKIN